MVSQPETDSTIITRDEKVDHLFDLEVVNVLVRIP